MNSHLTKNSEWGAVTYLTYSQYGRNGHKIDINDTKYTGGGSATTAYIETTNQKQSTTGNAYGIYDMSNGICEYVSIFRNVDAQNLYQGQSDWQKFTGLSTSSTSTKYATRYINKKSVTGLEVYEISKTGDGIKEVFIVSGQQCWFEDFNIGITGADNAPFMRRGNNIGIFYVINSGGTADSYIGYRVALCI